MTNTCKSCGKELNGIEDYLVRVVQEQPYEVVSKYGTAYECTRKTAFSAHLCKECSDKVLDCIGREMP